MPPDMLDEGGGNAPAAGAEDTVAPPASSADGEVTKVTIPVMLAAAKAERTAVRLSRPATAGASAEAAPSVRFIDTPIDVALGLSPTAAEPAPAAFARAARAEGAVAAATAAAASAAVELGGSDSVTRAVPSGDAGDGAAASEACRSMRWRAAGGEEGDGAAEDGSSDTDTDVPANRGPIAAVSTADASSCVDRPHTGATGAAVVADPAPLVAGEARGDSPYDGSRKIIMLAKPLVCDADASGLTTLDRIDASAYSDPNIDVVWSVLFTFSHSVMLESGEHTERASVRM